MPVVRKLAEEEVTAIEHKGIGPRKQEELMYDQLVTQFASGDWGELDLDENETKVGVRQKFNKAAMRAGMSIEWQRVVGSFLRFRVVDSPFEPVDSEMEPENEINAAEEANGETAALAEFELEPQPEPEPAPPAKKAPARRSPRVTGRTQHVEAP